MGRAFDIQPKRKVTRAKASLSPTPAVRRQSSAFMLLLLGIGMFVILATQIGSADQLTPIEATTPSQQPVSPTKLATSSPTTQPSESLTPPSSPSSTPSPTPTETPTPTPTPSVTTIAKDSLSISVLNGSGTPGEANELRQELEREGLTIRYIAVAKNQYATTTIYYRTGQRPEAEFVASFIPDRVVEFEENELLTKPDDVLIVVGAK